MAYALLPSPLGMRLAKICLQYGVMWVLVFVMSAGRLPLGTPEAKAAPTITDTPGIANFFTPRLFIIFDTSKSMVYRPDDPNSDPSVSTQDWDPTITHTLPDGGVAEGPDDTQCLNKFCIGKRALSQTLPTYTSRIDMGLAGYNQYYQLTTEPANYYTDCAYDQIAYGSTDWSRVFTSFDDLDGTDIDPTKLGVNSPVFSYQGPNQLQPHLTRKQGVASGFSGSLIYQNIVGASTGPLSTQSSGGYTYTWVGTRRWPPAGTSDMILKTSLGGVCPATRPGATDGTCSAAQPCDMYADAPPEALITYQPFTTGVDQGATVSSRGVSWSRQDPPAQYVYWGACGADGTPYNGGLGACNLLGDCTQNQTGGPTPQPVGAVLSYNNPVVSPGPAWTALPPVAHTTIVQLTAYGATCPGSLSTVSDSAGPPEWSSFATGAGGAGTVVNVDGTASSSTGCGPAAQDHCVWTQLPGTSGDYVVPAESNAHYCAFTRNSYPYQQFQSLCQYTINVWTYTTSGGDTYCNYFHNQDIYSHPIYTYAWLPNDGDILGYTSFRYNGNDDLHGVPTAVTYSGGIFSNNTCPNLINDPTQPPCGNGSICKLSWTSNTTVGAVNYPNGRYSNSPFGGYPWTSVPPGAVPAADPLISLLDKNFPPDPTVYSGNWLSGGGHGTNYYTYLMANLYETAWVNPPQQPSFPGQQLFTCSTCTYQYSYTAPPTNDALGFSAVATTMPPNRNSGFSLLPDGVTPAIAFTGIGTSTAQKGATLASSGPILKMLGKYDPVSNPTGLQIPLYGDYTPLTGALTNVKSYLQTQIDADPYAACGRKYYVMLLTDGEEEPLLAGNDPVGAVTALRGMTTSLGAPVDVKTFVIGFGLLAPSAELNAMAQAGGTSVSASDLGKLDLTANGVAFDGSSSSRLLASLQAAFGTILEGFFTRSKPAVNLAGTEMYIGYFRLLFGGTEWQGKLDSIDITQGNFPGLADTVTASDYVYYWRYGDDFGTAQGGSSINKQSSRTVYTSLSPNSGNRIFFDYNGCTDCASAAGWNTNAPADQTALETMIGANAKETIALLLNPGVPNSPESFSFGAQKLSRASDIFHSDPAIIEGATQSNAWPDPGAEAAAYLVYQNSAAIKSRPKTVYIGANDGMLHAVQDDVDALKNVGLNAGMERWGYVPNQLLPIVNQMRDAHTYGVDGSVAVADVCGTAFTTTDCTDPNGWRTLLVGALGRGGNGIYALDITDPTNPQVKWETSSSSSMVASRAQVPRFGQTWGAPVIGRTSVAGFPNKVWSVFIGGGVAPAVDPLSIPWGNNFYVLDASTGQPLFDGTTTAAFRIWNDPNDNPAGPVYDNPDGVASRASLYRPGDNASVQRVFFNDTEGKMWKMDVSGTSIATWNPSPTNTANDVFFDPANSSGNPNCVLDIAGAATPIVDATTGLPVSPAATLPLPKPRPKIFNRPMLAIDQTGLLDVYVGSGDSDHPNDPTGFDYFFGLTDLGTGCARPMFVLRFAQNEKMLADPAFLNNVVYATTYQPPSGALLCTDAGHGFLYAWDAHTGQPVAAIKDPLTGLMVSKLDFSNYPQLKNSGIPSAPIVRNGKIYLAFEADPKGRVVDTGAQAVNIKVKGWQRVK